MANLISSLGLTADALSAYSQVLEVTQNNVANASTPGWAAQNQTLESLPFEPSTGLAGGVGAGQIQSTRDEYAEQAVRAQTTLEGQANQDVSSLTSLQTLFDISGNSGIPYALNNLLQSFSAWAQTPTDTNARQLVITNASDLASAFQQTATGLSTVTTDTDQQLSQTTDQINQLVGQVQQENLEIMNGGGNDAGLDAEVHSNLEQLSQYVNITVMQPANGTYTVLLGDQTPLLVGSQQYQINVVPYQPTDAAATNTNAPPLIQLQAYDGTDITSQATSGQLGSLLQFRNTTLPSYVGDAYEAGDLNTLAQGIASNVNQILESGNVSDADPTTGAAAVPGVPLFTYDTNNPTNAAQSLAVDPSVTPDQLAAIQPAAADGSTPEVSNGIPLALSALADPQESSDEIGGQSYAEFYGQMASRVGDRLSAATNNQTVQQGAVAQAQNIRQQVSGVDLNQEAMTMVEFQRAYDANSRLITVLDDITEDMINLIPTTG
jgi:flagellar hook-associated protein 1 FlgK